MIYCEEKDLTYDELERIVLSAVLKVIKTGPDFPMSVYSVEDIKQEVFLQLLPRMPMPSTGYIYNSSVWAAKNFRRYILGRKDQRHAYDRGGKAQQIPEDYDVHQDSPNLRLVEVKDLVLFAGRDLTDDEWELWRAASEHGELKRLGKSKGMASSAMGYRWNHRLRPRLHERVSPAMDPER